MEERLTGGEVIDQDLVGETYEAGENYKERVIAAADGIHYQKSWRDDTSLFQAGSCHECGEDLVSWAKKTVCPECETRGVHLT